MNLNETNNKYFIIINMYEAYNLRRQFKFGFLIGRDINDLNVINHLERIGYTYRIVESDGEHYIITMDMRANRLDIRLRNNKIIDF